jgi:hypothetical protein
VVGIDLSFDCVADVSLVMPPCSPTTPLTISRSAPRDDSVNFPGLRPVDSHLDVIDTEILSMCNLNGGVVLKVGPSQVPILRRSLGAVAEDPGNPSLASSFFDVFFEVDLGGGQKAYNLDPLRLQGVISCAPPRATYIHPTGCIPLYSDPDPAPPNVHVANLVSAIHSVNVEKVPTVSQWGLIAIALLFVMAATIGLIRRRTAPWQSVPDGRGDHLSG